jgi:hypothetical protein
MVYLLLLRGTKEIMRYESSPYILGYSAELHQ